MHRGAFAAVVALVVLVALPVWAAGAALGLVERHVPAAAFLHAGLASGFVAGVLFTSAIVRRRRPTGSSGEDAFVDP